MSSELADGDETATRWDGYSQYENVSQQVMLTISRAVRALSRLDAAHDQNARLQAEDAMEAQERAQEAMVTLMPELEEDREVVDEYDRILSEWQGGEGGDGILDELKEADLVEEQPDWLLDLAIDLRKAGWHTGYLRAGRAERAGNGDPIEEETEGMFE